MIKYFGKITCEGPYIPEYMNARTIVPPIFAVLSLSIVFLWYNENTVKLYTFKNLFITECYKI